MSKVFIKKFYKNKAVRYRITIPETSMEWTLDRKTYVSLKKAILFEGWEEGVLQEVYKKAVEKTRPEQTLK